MKLALTAGGTGGHIFPAFAVLDAVLAAHPGTDVRFFGPEDRGERATIEARGKKFNMDKPCLESAVWGAHPLGVLCKLESEPVYQQLQKGSAARHSAFRHVP